MSIEIVNIKKSFGRTQVLNDISLDIPSGQMVALLGPSGSGKTTLLRIIAGLENQSSGHIRFHGTDVSRVHARDRKVGFVFQHYALFRHMTVFENIAFGLTVLPRRERPNAAGIKAKVTRLLEMVQLAHLADRYPAQLSGGQKQRIAIARALATNPKVLLCDEATSALDPNTTHAILQLIQKINREMGITVVIITHQMSVVEDVCSHVAILDNGTVVEQGSVRDIFSNPHSDAAKRLVFPAGTPERELLPGRKMVRVAFNGTQTTDKPLVASLAIECGALVSIVAADTRVVNGQTLGSMLLALPEGEGAAKALDYIKNYPGITYEEVGSNG